MIFDGRSMAKKIEEVLKRRISSRIKAPVLTVLAVGENPISERFIKMKGECAERLGVVMNVVHLPQKSLTEEVIDAIKKNAPFSNGIIVQLPLPETCDTAKILAAIPKEKDVDALSLVPLVPAPVVGAVERILFEGGVDLAGKRVLVIGRGKLVGAPLTKWLEGNGTTVEVIGDEVEDCSSYTQIADIIISGAGEPHLIKAHMIKEGAVIIDCGTSEAGGRMLGDADPDCASKCALLTPVPGGVGPVTVATLFENLLTLSDK